MTSDLFPAGSAAASPKPFWSRFLRPAVIRSDAGQAWKASNPDKSTAALTKGEVLELGKREGLFRVSDVSGSHALTRTGYRLLGAKKRAEYDQWTASDTRADPDSDAPDAVAPLEAGEDDDASPDASREASREADNAVAAETEVGTLMRDLFGALGQGDVGAARARLRAVIDARNCATAAAVQAGQEAEQARKAAAAAPARAAGDAGATLPGGGSYAFAGPVTLGALGNAALGKALGPRRAAMRVPGYDLATVADPNYSPEPDALSALAACDVTGAPCWLYGPAGTGKSSLVEWYAAKLGRPFVRVAFDQATEALDVIGGMQPCSDAAGALSMEWRDGAIMQAIRNPGTVLLLDEPTFARPGVLAMLQTLLDHGRFLLATATGERVRCAPDVLIVLADNTCGTGDATGQYRDTQDMNRSFLDRMAARVLLGYPEPDRETAMLCRRLPALPEPIAARMVRFAGLTRDAAAKGDMVHALGFRRLLAWGALMLAGLGSAQAFDVSCLAGEAPDDAEILRQLAGELDHGVFDAAICGGEG